MLQQLLEEAKELIVGALKNLLPAANIPPIVSQVKRELRYWYEEGDDLNTLEINLRSIFEEELLTNACKKNIVAQLLELTERIWESFEISDTDEELDNRAIEEVTRAFRIRGA